MPQWLITLIYAARDLLAEIAASVRGFEYAKLLFPVSSTPDYGSSLTDVLNHIHAMCVNIQSDVVNGTYGMSAAHTERLAIIGAISGLPTPPTPPTVGEITAGAWGYSPTGPGGYTTIAMLQGAFAWSRLHRWSVGLPLATDPRFMVSGPFNVIDEDYSQLLAPLPAWGEYLPDDTRLSWLIRTDTRYSWAVTDAPDMPVATAITGGVWNYELRPAFTEGDFQLWKLAASSRFLDAPVWPGDALATRGTPVALASGLTITEPMDGILVAITSVAAKQMYFTYDDARAYRHIGALAFVTDAGDIEGWQSLGFVSAIYTPRTMARAAGVKIMSVVDTVGTVTPWTRSTP
jgi:hypothetical protein